MSAGIGAFAAEVRKHAADWDRRGNGKERDNATLHATRQRLHNIAERCRDLTRQIDLGAKLAGRAIDVATKELGARDSDSWASKEINGSRKALEDARRNAVEQLRRTRYFVHQADWLQERFPEAELRDVDGLVKSWFYRDEIEANDWSLTPGRYVGVALEEEDEGFDFEEALRAIHIDLKELNEEATKLAAQIAKNFEEIGA